MRKILLLISLIIVLAGQSQILIREKCHVNGIELDSAFVMIHACGAGEINVDSSGWSFDTVITLYAHQYPSITAYLQKLKGLQIDELIDSYQYKNDYEFYQHYKDALLIKNPTWNPDNIIILQ